MIEEITQEEFGDFKSFKGTPREYVNEWSRLSWHSPIKIEDCLDPLYQDRPVKKVSFASLGWSGNESLQSTIRRTMFHMLYWESSHRGGLEVYYVPSEKWDSADHSRVWAPLWGEDDD